MKDPIEAFDWLLAAFRRYSKNQMSWLEVQSVLREAEVLRAMFTADVEVD
jgi:hypothetical protein